MNLDRDRFFGEMLKINDTVFTYKKMLTYVDVFLLVHGPIDRNHCYRLNKLCHSLKTAYELAHKTHTQHLVHVTSQAVVALTPGKKMVEESEKFPIK